MESNIRDTLYEKLCLENEDHILATEWAGRMEYQKEGDPWESRFFRVFDIVRFYRDKDRRLMQIGYEIKREPLRHNELTPREHEKKKSNFHKLVTDQMVCQKIRPRPWGRETDYF